MGIMIYSLLRVMQDLYHQPYLGVPYLFIVYHSLVGATSMQILTLGFLMCVCGARAHSQTGDGFNKMNKDRLKTFHRMFTAAAERATRYSEILLVEVILLTCVSNRLFSGMDWAPLIFSYMETALKASPSRSA